MSCRSPLANSCSPKSKFYFTKRTSSPLANNSSRRTIVHPIQNMLFGELKFAIGERSSRRTSSRRTLVRGGWFSSRERIFWRTVRHFAAEYGRTRANSAEPRRTFGVLRRTFAGVRRSVGVGEPMANSRGVHASSLEFARVRASSRRTTVRRVYCRFIAFCIKPGSIKVILTVILRTCLSTSVHKTVLKFFSCNFWICAVN